MSTADTAQKQVKTENQQCPTSETVAAGKHGKDRQKPKNGVKDEAVLQATVASSDSEVPNLLFSRLSSGKVKKDAGGEAQRSKAPSRNRSQAGTSKAPRQRKKPAVNQVAEVTKHLHTKLEKDDGVAVECTFLAEDGRAVVDEKSRDWVHILKLNSELPFYLIKQTILQSGPYTGHLALIVRQETPFRFLSLPLHLRAKIYAFALKYDGPTIPIVMRGSTRTVWSPSYHSPNALALLRTCKQIRSESTPIIYAQAFSFPGTQVACEFLLKISRNRSLVRILRCDAYTSLTARTMFQLLPEARNLQKLSFTHVSSSETPRKAVNNIWNDAGAWLMVIEVGNPTKGLEVLEFGEKAFHMREKDKKSGGYKVTCWGPNEQLEFLKGLRAKMVAGPKRLKKAD